MLIFQIFRALGYTALAMLILTGCSDPASSGPAVFAKDGFTITGLENLHFGQSCESVFETVKNSQFQFSEYQEVPHTRNNTILTRDAEVPVLGTMYISFQCSGDDKLSLVQFTTNGLTNISRFNAALQTLEGKWGKPDKTFQTQAVTSAGVMYEPHLVWNSKVGTQYELYGAANPKSYGMHLIIFPAPADAK